MKYRDLIKLLEPVADEEINMTTSVIRDFAYEGGKKPFLKQDFITKMIMVSLLLV